MCIDPRAREEKKQIKKKKERDRTLYNEEKREKDTWITDFEPFQIRYAKPYRISEEIYGIRYPIGGALHYYYFLRNKRTFNRLKFRTFFRVCVYDTIISDDYLARKESQSIYYE